MCTADFIKIGWPADHFQNSGLPPSWIYEIRYLVMYSLCLSVILLLRNKFRVNWTINRWPIAKRWFSIWRTSTIVNFESFDFASGHQFHRHRIIRSWDIAIKPFAIWRPSTILNSQNFDFLARSHSCIQNLHQYTKVHESQIVYGWVIAIKGFSKWRPSAMFDLLWRHHIAPWNSILVPNTV